MVTVPTYPPVRQPSVWNAWMEAVEAWRNGFTPSGVFISPHDYVIIQETADYTALNGFQRVYGGADDAGAVDGGDFDAVFQAALDDADSSNGMVYLGALTATASSHYEYYDNTRVVGSGEERTVISYAGSDFLFQPSAATVKNNVHMSDFAILLTADNAGLGGVDWDGCIFGSLKNIKIWNTAGTKVNPVGVQVTDTQSVGCYFNKFENLNISNMLKGMFFEDNDWDPNVNRVDGGRFSGCTTGIHLEGGVNTRLDTPDFEGDTTGIYVESLMNTMINPYCEGNTLDVDVETTGSLVLLGGRRDLNITNDGDLIFLGVGYADADAWGNKNSGLHTGTAYTFYREYLGTEYATPDTSFINFGTAASTLIDFTIWKPRQARIVVTAQGDEAGNTKGLRIATAAADEVCKVEWNGNGLQTRLAGDWTDFPLGNAEYGLQLDVKASSATENITVYFAELQFR